MTSAYIIGISYLHEIKKEIILSFIYVVVGFKSENQNSREPYAAVERNLVDTAR